MFSDKDILLIDKNIDNIINDAYITYKQKFCPTTKENEKVYNDILTYIKDNSKMVYGGFAHNLYLLNKKDEGFYKTMNNVNYNWPVMADIEFYSNDPVNDIIKLAEYLYNKGHKYIEAKEALKSDTFKLYVNFESYCDVTYMPNNIYNKIPTIDINKFNCIDPYVAYIDYYRVLTDPMLSYWKLEKIINRIQKLMKHYNFNNLKNKNKKNSDDNINQNICDDIINNITKNNLCVIVGYYAYDYYMKLSNTNHIGGVPYIEIIIENVMDKHINIYNILKVIFNGNITFKKYNKYFQYLDNRIEYYNNNKLILILYGTNNICSVYNKITDNINIGTLSLTIMFLLINNIYSITNKSKNNENISKKSTKLFQDNTNLLYNSSTVYRFMIKQLYISRNEYLIKNSLSVLDKSPFKEFIINCIGETTGAFRTKLLLKKKRFNYTPSGSAKKFIWYPEEVTDGCLIKNNNLLKKKKYNK